jgi:hypothetical protein
MTGTQIERRTRNVLRRNGMQAGKAYAMKHNYTVPGGILRTAALRWERWHFRANLRKSLGKFGYQLYRLKTIQAEQEGRS